MNIGVNFSYKLIASRGIARFIENILSNVQLTTNDKIHFFIPEQCQDFDSFDCPYDYNLVKLNSSNYFIFEHLKLPAAVKKFRISVLLNPANTVPILKNTYWLTVIHDVIPFKLECKPFTKKWLVNVYMRYIMKKGISKSENLVTVSEYSKTDIHSLNIKHKDITVVYNGFNHKTINNKAQPIPELPKDYYFWLGGDGYNKNINLIKQLLIRKKVKYPLCVVGVKKDENVKELESLGAKVFVNISDEKLATLYKKAKVFIFPSLYEGFGIPILEALHNKVPYILSSNRTSLPEVCGDSCHLFDPTNIEQAEQLINAAFNDKLESKLKTYKKQLSKFNWVKEAEKVSSLLKEYK